VKFPEQQLEKGKCKEPEEGKGHKKGPSRKGAEGRKRRRDIMNTEKKEERSEDGGGSEHGVVDSEKDQWSLVPGVVLPPVIHDSSEWLPRLGEGKPPFLFMLSGWSSISTTSLMIHSICPGFLGRILVSLK
jgi:hypothetical protein